MATLLSHPDTINTWAVDVPSRAISASLFLRGLDYSDDEHHTIIVPVGEDPEESDEAEKAVEALAALADLYAFFTSNLIRKTSEVNDLYKVWRENRDNDVLLWIMPDEDMVREVDQAMVDLASMPVYDTLVNRAMQATTVHESACAPYDMKVLDESWVMGSDV